MPTAKTLVWARAEISDDKNAVVQRNSNGTLLTAGDKVALIKNNG
jgi:uncharacterized Zn ribbon protein